MLALLGVLELSTALALARCPRQPADDRIGAVCVAPAPTAVRDQRLDAGVEIYVHVYIDGDPEECVSSTSLSGLPAVEEVAPSRWRVVGGFVDAEPDRPRTPDCNGGTVVATLGTLASGSYILESTLGELSFALPSAESRICLSRP